MKTYIFGAICLCLSIFSFETIQAQIDASIDDITIGCIDDLKALPAPNVQLVKINKACRNPRVTHAEDIISPATCSSKTLRRTYLITDDCQNRKELIQEISFLYEERKPDDIFITISLGCNPLFPGAIPDPKEFSAPDCSENFEWLGDERTKDGCNFQLIRKYLITTECGNTHFYTIQYSWKEDYTPPVIACPEDLDLGCNPGAIPPPDPSQVKAKDECCNPTVSWLTDVIVTNPGDCHQIRIRKYIAEDCCGNQAICEQKISWISDMTPPLVLDCPADAYLGCNTNLQHIESFLPKPNPDALKAQDACNEISITHTLSDVTFFGCEYSITRIYTVTDKCGNSTDCYQTFTWTVDDTPPVIRHCPADIDLGCNPETTGLGLQSPDYGIIATDNCGIDKITRTGTSEVFEDGCKKYYWIEYTVYDHCGNSSTCTQKVSWMEDHDPPVITCPEDIDLGCNPAAIPAPDPTLVKAEDRCCIPTVTWLTDVIISNPDDCHQMRIRKYLAQDCCGNEAICEQKIRWISDATAPIIIDCPGDVYLGCNPEYDDLNDLLPKPTPDDVKAEDGCSQISIQHRLSDITVFGCEYSISRIYIVTDDCGNSAQCSQTFTWTVDEIAPVIQHCPSDIDLGCNPERTDLSLQSPDYGIIATDNCGIEKIKRTATSEVIEAGCQKYYWIEYTVYDHCGNSSVCQQKVSWTEDREPPVISCPPTEYYCNTHDIPPVDLGKVTVTDNCGVDDVYISASSISLVDGVTFITRTFTAVDFCGNEASCDQEIVIAPQFYFTSDSNIAVYDTFPQIDPFDLFPLCPESINYGCVTELPVIPEPDLKFIISPECIDARVTHLGDDLQQINPCEYVLSRYYRFVDCCGEIHECSQAFRWRLVDDTTTIIPFPEDQVAFCEIPPVPDFAYDCGKYIPIYLGQTIQGDCDDGSCKIIRHWKSAVCGGVQLLHDQMIEVKCDITFGLNSLAVENPIVEERIELFPNPARQRIYANLEGVQSIKGIQILNMNGQMMKVISSGITNSDRFEINIEDLTPGMYILRINGENTVTEKFIKSE